MDQETLRIVLMVLAGLISLALFLALWVFIPATMAQRRNRNPIIWVLISFVGSPILAILLLIALGPQKQM